MMEHIRQFDWCSSDYDDMHFITEQDIDNSVTEKILRNKFYDPLLSSDSENETPNKINWDEVFKQRRNRDDMPNKIFVPGLRQIPQYPKLSALTIQQHYQCLKILSAQNPKILPGFFYPRPTKQDFKVFQDVKEIYEKEQKEYLDWARTLWTTDQCVRALRPKPAIEMVYEAEFKMKAQEMQSFPKTYSYAAQIPLEMLKQSQFKMVLDKTLIDVKVTELPQIDSCIDISKRFSIVRPCSVPEPCNKHPCRFILPNESRLSELPLTEINRELAQYTIDNGAQYIVSENALKCLLEQDRHWTLPLFVCEVIHPDGGKCNVVVMGREFSINREPAQMRSYRAFKHLLQNALLPPSEKAMLVDRGHSTPSNESSKDNTLTNDMAMSSDDDDDELVIDTGEMQIDCAESDQANKTAEESPSQQNEEEKKTEEEIVEISKSDADNKDQHRKASQIGFYHCSCKDSLFEHPPPRTFMKWQVKNETGDAYNIIVHSSHKVRDKSGEVLLEPVMEYQLELGGCELSEDKNRSLALSLLLRKNATVLNVRVDGPSGDVVTMDSLRLDDLTLKYKNIMSDTANVIHTTINQLCGLLPGSYVLQHEPSHGKNAFLYASKSGANSDLTLNFDFSQLTEMDEAKIVKNPPTLTPVLLPYHKSRKILPCAFSPFENHLVRETRRPVTRQKTPPQAIKWPKKKKRNTRR